MSIPTIHDLLIHPEIIRAMDAAWADSFPEDPLNRHEEGDWIYFRPDTGQVTTRRAPRGELDFIALGRPTVLSGWYIVGMFHTHPNPTAEGWNPEPSQADRRLHEWAGVPGIVVSDGELFTCGPSVRGDGLTGGEGFPTTKEV